MKSDKLLALALLLLALLFACYVEAQAPYQTVLDYFPEQREEVSEEDYRKGINILESTYAHIRKNSAKIVYANHLNIATAFSLLKEPQYKIMKELTFAQEENLESTAKVFLMAFKKPSAFNLTQQQYDSLHIRFTAVVAEIKEEIFDLENYVKEGGFDKGLVTFMQQLNEKDKQHRGLNDNREKQRPLDAANIQAVDSLFAVYGKYIGKSQVGDKFSSTMWAIIQHADLARQEKYLPLVWQGVKDGELHEMPLKMLIDRVYAQKYGYQIFGSQSKSLLASDEIIAEVKKEYSLE
jgi:hypothetical protein